MKVIGIAKLTSKKGNHMAKVECLRSYTPEEQSRLELAAGDTVETLWIFEPAMDKLDGSYIGKEIEPVLIFSGGKASVVDIKLSK